MLTHAPCPFKPDPTELVFGDPSDLHIAQPIRRRVIREPAAIEHGHTFTVTAEPHVALAVLKDGTHATLERQTLRRRRCVARGNGDDEDGDGAEKRKVVFHNMGRWVVIYAFPSARSSALIRSRRLVALKLHRF